MTKPNALIFTAAGINCDLELAHAFEAAGCLADRVHINQIIAEPAMLDRYELIGLPGGFSFGDAVAAGRIMAQLIRKHLYGPIIRAVVERGVPVIAPCNGFQIAVQAGLLPGPDAGDVWPNEPARQTVTLAPNASSRFVDRWVRMAVPDNTRCIWTRGLSASDETRMLPVAHGEGRFVASSNDLIDRLGATGQVAIRYAADDNPNGSADDIAGICDHSGLIFGLMPHPERYTRFTQHPFWTRLSVSQRDGETLGLAMFRQAVAFVTSGTVRKSRSATGSQVKSAPQGSSPVRLSS